MSAEAEATGAVMCCANCGIAGVDEIKLEECQDCDLVSYCSDKCKDMHREQHCEECKIRAAKLHDKRLFTQPDRNHLGECPICFLPMPLEKRRSVFNSCCGQWICNGCIYENYLTNRHDRVKRSRCVFCRTPASDKEEHSRRKRERIEANDPGALCCRGSECYEEGNYDGAFENLTKAAELENVDAHYFLGFVYGKGKGVEKDEDKGVYHFEKAAIGGHIIARHNLALYETENGRLDRAVKHLIIAANLGHDKSMKTLLPFYKDGYITKEEYGSTLRTHQAAIDATKSAQRDAAEVLADVRLSELKEGAMIRKITPDLR
jgi:hypothetical protein